MSDLISKSRLKKELSKIPSEMGLIKKAWVMQTIEKQKTQDSNSNCNCQHNSNSRDNEPCYRCDSRQTNAEIVKVDSLEIITQMLDDKPYYELKYRLVGKNDYFIGYSSYDLKIVLGYIDEYFEIVKSDKHTNADRIRNMTDEELAEFLVTFKNTFGKECEGEASCIEWLQSEAE